MELSSRTAFYISAILHGVFFVTLIVWTLISSLIAKEDNFVFTMVSPPASALQSEKSPLSSEESPSEIQAPEVEAEPLPSLSYEEFIKQHGAPKAQKSVTPVKRKVTVKDIDTENLREDLEKALASDHWQEVSRMTAVQQDEFQRYIGSLKAQINQAWNKPSQLSGRQFVATLRFTVSSKGVIYDVKITDSSKNELFDHSVLTAFDRVGRAAPTPDGNAYSLILTFRMKE